MLAEAIALAGNGSGLDTASDSGLPWGEEPKPMSAANAAACPAAAGGAG